MPDRKLPSLEEMVALYNKGLSHTAIAKICDVKPNTVAGFLTRWGIHKPRKAYISADPNSPEWFETYFWQRTWPEPNTGCWFWVGRLSKDGYGNVRKGNTYIKAHRLSYERFIGPIPPGLTIDHLCRNIICVNPDHLEAVSSGVNTLRGDTIPARHLKRTTCNYGHPFDRVYKNSRNGRMYRACSTCQNIWDKKAKAKRLSEHVTPDSSDPTVELPLVQNPETGSNEKATLTEDTLDREIPITFIIPLGAKNKPIRYTAKVDAKDYPRVSGYQWFWLRGRHTVYAHRNACYHGHKYHIYMHRELLELGPDDPQVDHKNGVGTDNRRENLRLATPSENQQNRHYRRKYSSKYRGVIWDYRLQCWRARVRLNYEMVVNKTFKDELEAAKCAEEGRSKFFSHYEGIG